MNVRPPSNINSKARVPKHVAIIMDGNGRWAKSRRKPRIYGHVRGATRVKPVVRLASELGVEALTLFAFSTENWSRPKSEIQVLWKLLKKYLRREGEELHRENVRLNFIGQVDRLDQDILDVLLPLQEKLAGNTGLNLTFCISYGSRDEIASAAKKIAADVKTDKLSLENVNEQVFSHYLSTSFMGDLADVDLVIRTSGERRISNFLLWQAAYAEYYFSDVLWPDFAPSLFRAAVDEYSIRERRFGHISAPDVPVLMTTENNAPGAQA